MRTQRQPHAAVLGDGRRGAGRTFITCVMLQAYSPVVRSTSNITARYDKCHSQAAPHAKRNRTHSSAEAHPDAPHAWGARCAAGRPPPG
jgi:hypothetical protein